MAAPFSLLVSCSRHEIPIDDTAVSNHYIWYIDYVIWNIYKCKHILDHTCYDILNSMHLLIQ